MKIGILTFYRVPNFGANLQAISTYLYLKNHGHEPVMIIYDPKRTNERNETELAVQAQTHLQFVDTLMPSHTQRCNGADEINIAIKKYKIEAIIVGSDAVVQHHPLLSRIHKGRRKPFYFSKLPPERMFPNPFWGVDIDPLIPMAMMSVSSQNSRFKLFSKSLKKRMAEALSRMKYISVRDAWTQQLILSVLDSQCRNVPITPDPVFAFNYNVSNLIPTVEDIRSRFNLPDKYVLVCLNAQNLEASQLQDLENKFASHGLHCVAFTLPVGIKFNHPFAYKVDTPLDPLDWYALIKYASGYVGCNMHPIVVSLHNAVPCFSIDHWGTRNFWGRSKDDGSSKVADILERYGLGDNRAVIENNKCVVDSNLIVDKILNYPKGKVAEFSKEWTESYKLMMDNILKSF